MIKSNFKTIVVGTDFSEGARAALAVAVDLAGAHRAKVIIVHGVDPMIASLEVSPQAIIDDIRKGLSVQQGLAAGRGVEVTAEMRMGKGWWSVNEAAREFAADIVVVGTHGRSGLARAALGSTADRVVRTCASPVLVVPGQVASPTTWRTAIVGVDFSEESKSAAALAASVLVCSRASGRSLTLFHTVALTIDFAGSVTTAALPQHWEQAEAAAGTSLHELVRSLGPLDSVEVNTIIDRGFAADGILREAQARQADFIAVGTHGRTTLNRMLLGSVAERVLHHAGRPVLAVRHASL